MARNVLGLRSVLSMIPSASASHPYAYIIRPRVHNSACLLFIFCIPFSPGVCLSDRVQKESCVFFVVPGRVSDTPRFVIVVWPFLPGHTFMAPSIIVNIESIPICVNSVCPSQPFLQAFSMLHPVPF